jgi:hypothetical protein
MGAVAGPYVDSTRAAFVLHELDELIHHAAEVAALRDLYRALRPGPVENSVLNPSMMPPSVEN